MSVETHSFFKSVKAPAKLNIVLKITGRRENGYHDLVSVMVAVDLCDQLELAPGPPGISLTSFGHQVPGNENNIVIKAATAFLSLTGINPGLSIKLTKNIPVAAGLGGGSSDAASVLKTLNEIFENPLSDHELARLAVGLGADVPFFLKSRPSIARGIGEILEPVENWPKVWYVIITPPIMVSTSWVYSKLKLKLTTHEYSNILRKLKKVPFDIAHILENDLESIACSHYPVIDGIKKYLLKTGAEGVLMSGSGPSVFGIFKSKNKAIQAKRRLESQHFGFIVAVEGIS